MKKHSEPPASNALILTGDCLPDAPAAGLFRTPANFPPRFLSIPRNHIQFCGKSLQNSLARDLLSGVLALEDESVPGPGGSFGVLAGRSREVKESLRSITNLFLESEKLKETLQPLQGRDAS